MRSGAVREARSPPPARGERPTPRAPERRPLRAHTRTSSHESVPSHLAALCSRTKESHHQRGETLHITAAAPEGRAPRLLSLRSHAQSSRTSPRPHHRRGRVHAQTFLWETGGRSPPEDTFLDFAICKFIVARRATSLQGFVPPESSPGPHIVIGFDTVMGVAELRDALWRSEEGAQPSSCPRRATHAKSA